MRAAGGIAILVTVVMVGACGQSRETSTGFLDRKVTLAGRSYAYQVYVPANYTRDQASPILVDLHGNGAQGSDGIRQTAHFLADQIRLQRSLFPLLVVFPQAARGTDWSAPAMQDMVVAELDDVIAEFYGDRDRLYLSGFSMGGAGVFEIAARWPDRFAALVAISGFVPTDHADLLKRIHRIPLRVFHSARDERLPVDTARRLVAELTRAGGLVQYVEYSDADHGSTAERTYADPSVLSWLLRQRRD